MRGGRTRTTPCPRRAARRNRSCWRRRATESNAWRKRSGTLLGGDGKDPSQGEEVRRRFRARPPTRQLASESGPPLTADVVVIGGGVIGTSIASALSSDGVTPDPILRQ